MQKVSDEEIINLLKRLIAKNNRFPTFSEIYLEDKYLCSIISKNGGISKYKQMLGYSTEKIRIKKPKWKDEYLISEIKKVISVINRFPTTNEIIKYGCRGLNRAITRNGGYKKFKKIIDCHGNYTNDDRIVLDLKEIEILIGHFPTSNNIVNLKEWSLLWAIQKNGGINKFRKMAGYKPIFEPNRYSTEKIIINEITELIDNLGHFPVYKEIQRLKGGLIKSIYNTGGINKYRRILGHPVVHISRKEWNKTETYSTIHNYIDLHGYFPNRKELEKNENNELSRAIRKHGGHIKLHREFGFPIDYWSLLTQYINKRGKKTENIVYDIITDYCIQKNLKLPIKNYRIEPKGGIIEFVCNLNKKIGIDVTNTKTKKDITNKWQKREYHKYLDELLIVVFSNTIKKEEYIILNEQSPDNVYVLTIEEFCNKLQYDLNDIQKNTIEQYKSCTFEKRNLFSAK